MVDAIVFDMDGTIADLYGVDDWLPKLRGEDPSPYLEAAPLTDLQELYSVLEKYMLNGIKIIISSWCSKEATEEYNKQVRKAKKAWLKNHNFPCNEIHIVKYGTPKSKTVKKTLGEQVLIDDDSKVRNEWKHGRTINPTTQDICNELIKILSEVTATAL